jgi:hypothetical protein
VEVHVNNINDIVDSIYYISKDIYDSLNSLELSLELSPELKMSRSIKKFYITTEELAMNACAVRRNLKLNLFGEDFAYHLGKIYSRAFSMRDYFNELLQITNLSSNNVLARKLHSEIDSIETQMNRLNPHITKIFSI